MKKVWFWIVILLLIIVVVALAIWKSTPASVSSSPLAPGESQSETVQPESAASDSCGPDSEPQCFDHTIGEACTNVRDGNIPGTCKEAYDYRACVCR